MEITKKEIEHIAKLSNLNFTDSELEMYAKHMTGIVDFANELNQLDTDNVEITTSVLGEYNIFRKDEVQPSFDRDLLLQNAPTKKDGMFEIPKVIGG